MFISDVNISDLNGIGQTTGQSQNLAMRREIIHLRPTGWDLDPDDERFKLSTLDYMLPQVFSPHALFFRLSDGEKPKALAVLTEGLEVTLSQCRQLCGFLEEYPEGGALLPQEAGQHGRASCPVA